MVVCVLWPAFARGADAGDPPRLEADEDAATTEARRRALAAVLADAERARALNDAHAAASLLNRAGQLQLKLNSPEEALAAFQSALAFSARAQHPAIRVDALNGLAAAHNQLGRCRRARPLLDEAVTLSEQIGHAAGKAEALLTLSDCQNLGDHTLALSTAREALAIWQAAGDKRGVARSYSAIGHYEMARSDLAAAAQSHEAALKVWGELGAAKERAESLIFLAFIEYRRGDWQNVFKFLSQAEILLDEKDDPYKMGQIAGCYGEAFIESGMPEIGLAKLLQAKEYYRLTQNKRAATSVVWGIGKAHYHLGEYPEALANLHSALADAGAADDTQVAALCHDFLGRTYGAMNNPAAALRHLGIAYRMYRGIGNPVEAARARALMGQVYERQGRAARARGHYLSALGTFRALSDRVNESATLYALGSLELRQNDLDAAEHHLRESIAVTEHMRRVSNSRDLTASFSATVYDRYEKYVECLMRQHEAHPERDLARQAFLTSDLGRARALAELLRATQTARMPGLDPKLAEREKSLRLALRVKEDSKITLLSGAHRKEELDALEAETARLEAEYRQLTEAIRARHPAYERMTESAAWDLRRIQELVVADDETLLLEYMLGADRSYVWAVTREGLRSYELPARAPVSEAARKAYEALTAPPDAGGAEASAAAVRELSRMILSPVAADLNKRRIIVLADNVLHYIPFQALHSPSADGEPLIARHEIVNAHSASTLGELQLEARRRRPAAKMLAAFGNPVFASSYARVRGTGEHLAAAAEPELRGRGRAPRDIELDGDTFDPSVIKPLFYARRELEDLLDVTAGEETFVAADFDATRERLLGTDLSQYAIVHFATHGLLDPKRPEHSGLVLSTVDRDGRALDGFVGLRNIYELHAPVNMVVLSACQTALGKDVRGEGLIGLTRGFMYAGASSVVASLWKVDDEATAVLMREFYVNLLRNGATPAEALRAAQNSVRQRPEWRAPYYWAAFTLQGEHSQVIRPRRAAAPTRALLGFALLLLLAAVPALGYWQRRRRVRRAEGAVIRR